MPFGLWSRKVQVTVDRQKQVDINYAIRQLEQGNLSFILKDNIRLDSDRFIILSLHDVSLLESGLARAAGLARLAEADRGTMTITLDGITFAGQAGRHISADFGDIEAVDHDHDGIAIATRARAQKLHFGGVSRTIVPVKVKDRIYDQPLSGKVVRLVIEGVMKISLEEGG